MADHKGADTPPVRRKRASKARLRFFAWTASGLSFLGALLSFALSPKPAQGALPTTTKSLHARPVVVVVTKKIVYAPAAKAVPVSTSGPVNYVYTPAAPPVAVSCGTTPC